MPILRFFKSMFLSSKKACFQTTTSANFFSRCILQIKTLTKFEIFDPNDELPALKKANFVRLLNRCFHGPDSLVFDIKRQNSFFAIHFYDLLHGVTGG